MRAEILYLTDLRRCEIEDESELYHKLMKAKEAERGRDYTALKFAEYPLCAIAFISACCRWWWSVGLCVAVFLVAMFIFFKHQSKVENDTWEDFVNALRKRRYSYFYKPILRSTRFSGDYSIDMYDLRIAVTSEPIEDWPTATELIKKHNLRSGFSPVLAISNEVSRLMKDELEKKSKHRF